RSGGGLADAALPHAGGARHAAAARRAHPGGVARRPWHGGRGDRHLAQGEGHLSDSSSSPAGPRRLRGVLAPVLTPFHADLTPDARRLEGHCRWLLAHGCAALAPFGTTSEANSLSVDEREILLDAIVEHGVPAERLLPGTGACSLS